MEWLNNVLGVVIGVLTILGIAIGVLSVVLKRRNNGKATPVTEVLDVASTIIDHSLDMVKRVPDLVVKAEEMFGPGKGANKLDYVLTQLQLYALQNKTEYNEPELKDYIEKVIYTTKTVNVTNKEE